MGSLWQWHTASPPRIAALNQIVECLGEWPVPDTVIHTGSAGSGLGIDCCPALVRVETDTLTPEIGRGTLVNVNKCKPVNLGVRVLYRECWVAQNDTPQGRPAADYNVMGTNVVLSWWQAIDRLTCCTPYNQLIELIEERDHEPDGCVGWDLTLNVKVSLCGCSAE